MTAAERAGLLFRARWELGLRGRQPWAGVLARFEEATRDAPLWTSDEPDAMKRWTEALTREQRHALRLPLAELSGNPEDARGECRCATCDPRARP